MNKIIITGRLTKDPELKTTDTGIELCNFTVAVDRRAKKDAEKQTDFFDCTAWRQSGVFVNKYFKKGDGINIEGRMESRRWVDHDGKNRIGWGVTVDNVEFPHGRSNGSSAGRSDLPGDDFEEIPVTEELPF